MIDNYIEFATNNEVKIITAIKKCPFSVDLDMHTLEVKTGLSREEILYTCRKSPILLREGESILLMEKDVEEPKGKTALVLEQLRARRILRPTREENKKLYKEYAEESLSRGDKPLPLESYKATYRRLRRLYFFSII